MNEYEAKQKVTELTPQYFDSPELIQQKLAAIPVYLNSLKVRANIKEPQASVATNPAAANPQMDAISAELARRKKNK
jgi:hypothetical protein